MASLADLFNPTFLMFLGILVLVVSLLVVYFESKMRDQNHKMSAMLSLVSTLAEDMNGMKHVLLHSVAKEGGTHSLPLDINNEVIVSKSNELGEVDVDDEDTDADTDTDAGSVSIEEASLIEVSDDDDSHSDGDIEAEELDMDPDAEEDINDISEDDISVHDIKVLKLDEVGPICDDLDDICDNPDNGSIEDFLNKLDTTNENKVNEIDTDLKSVIKTIDIHLDDSKREPIQEAEAEHEPENEHEHIVDYKKMSLTKLRSVVSEKGLATTDVSKLKKHDLLKLLGME